MRYVRKPSEDLRIDRPIEKLYFSQKEVKEMFPWLDVGLLFKRRHRISKKQIERIENQTSIG
jgi:hypothetical protein